MNCLSSETSSFLCPIAELRGEFKTLRDTAHTDTFGDDGAIVRHLQLAEMFDVRKSFMNSVQLARGHAAMQKSTLRLAEILDSYDDIADKVSSLEATYNLENLQANCPDGVTLAENRHGELLRTCGSTLITDAQRQDTQRSLK